MKNMLRIFLLFAIATEIVIPLSVTEAVQSQPAPIPEYDCSKVQNTTSGMLFCAIKEANFSQLKLDRLVKQLSKTEDKQEEEFRRGEESRSSNLSEIRPNGSLVLQLAQFEWSAYRNNHCRWKSDVYFNGSIAPTILMSCINSLTLNRIDELKIVLCAGKPTCSAAQAYDRPKPQKSPT